MVFGRPLYKDHWQLYSSNIEVVIKIQALDKKDTYNPDLSPQIATQMVPSPLLAPNVDFFKYLFTIFSRIFGPRGGCASSRLDHSLKTLPGRLH